MSKELLLDAPVYTYIHIYMHTPIHIHRRLNHTPMKIDEKAMKINEKATKIDAKAMKSDGKAMKSMRNQ